MIGLQNQNKILERTIYQNNIQSTIYNILVFYNKVENLNKKIEYLQMNIKKKRDTHLGLKCQMVRNPLLLSLIIVCVIIKYNNLFYSRSSYLFFILKLLIHPPIVQIIPMLNQQVRDYSYPHRQALKAQQDQENFRLLRISYNQRHLLHQVP